MFVLIVSQRKIFRRILQGDSIRPSNKASCRWMWLFCCYRTCSRNQSPMEHFTCKISWTGKDYFDCVQTLNHFSSQISYSSSSVVLSDRSRFRMFFRNTFNMQIIAPALRSAVAHFNWTRIALLTQDEGLFTGVHWIIDD